jgi:retron-type reverse transcriptase
VHYETTVAALEDKIVQYAAATILNQIYEEDFLGFSYGFRPGRSQHDALDALSYALLKKKVNYILDADIASFFDNLDKSWLMKFVEHRVADPRILRLIQKWLKAGVMEEGKWSEPKTGSPQGCGDHSTYTKDNFEFDRRVNFERRTGYRK